jgi:hypothetical protein
MRLSTIALLLVFSPACFAAEAPAAAPEIASATLPLPTFMRDGAAVVRLDAKGYPQPLRAGSNGMVCIADKPDDDQLDARCYQRDFIVVVYRSFQLRGQTGGAKVGERIEAEIKAGKIHLPPQPTAGYRCLGPIADYDAVANTYRPPVECWQSVHFPYRTAAELGLPDESQVSEAQKRTLPYVMSSGRYWAHVMIEHPDEK